MKTIRNPEQVHGPLGVGSHQVQVDGPMRWLVLSGQVGMTPDGKIPEDPAEQFAVALENVRLNLAAAGMEVPDIVKFTVFGVGDLDMPRIQKEVIIPFLDGHKPCGTRLVVAGLGHPSFRVSIDVWACRDQESQG